MSEENKKTEADVILAAGAALAQLKVLDGVPVIVAPYGYKVESLEHLLVRPVRKKGLVSFFEVQSFIDYVEAHAIEGVTSIFMDRSGRFVAVFDHHDEGGDHAGWNEFRADYSPALTPEWQRWIGKNKIRMNQVTFAEFIEEGLREIISPEGAEMLEIAKRIEATSSVAFVAGVKLENGNQALRYEETTEAKAGAKGELTVPSTFQVGMKIYEGEEPYRIEARLRYRIENRGLVLWYELINPHLVIQDVLKSIRERITAETHTEVYSGSLNS